MASELLTRVLRRETHSPRTVAAVVVLVLLALAACYAGVEIVLALLGRSPLLVTPAGALRWLGELPQAQPRAAVIAGGVVGALLGVVLLWLALSPGRLPRHRLGGRLPVLVDNAVIASAVAERVRRELDLARGGVVVGIGHRSADVSLRPEPGESVDQGRVRAAVQDELSGYRLSPALTVRVRVHGATNGDLR